MEAEGPKATEETRVLRRSSGALPARPFVSCAARTLSAAAENSVGPFRFGAFGAALPLPVVRAPENSQRAFWFNSSRLKIRLLTLIFLRSSKEENGGHPMLVELFITACALSVVSLLASIWLNNDDGELT